MTYDIRKTDGTRLVELDNEIIDTETLSGIGLIGRLTANYGETQSNNFVHIVENFASKEFPENPLVGQICYKKESTTGSLYVYDVNKKWKKMPLIIISEGVPEGDIYVNGDIWYDIGEHSLNVYDEAQGWVVIGPESYNNRKTYTEESVSEDNSWVDVSSFKLEKRNAGYMLEAKVIGKEVNRRNSDEMTNSAISGWIIKAMVNVYNSDGWKYEFVEEPDYELIGTNASDWMANIEIEKNNADEYEVKIKAKGAPSDTTKQVKWIGSIDVLKVMQDGSN